MSPNFVNTIRFAASVAEELYNFRRVELSLICSMKEFKYLDFVILSKNTLWAFSPSEDMISKTSLMLDAFFNLFLSSAICLSSTVALNSSSVAISSTDCFNAVSISFSFSCSATDSFILFDVSRASWATSSLFASSLAVSSTCFEEAVDVVFKLALETEPVVAETESTFWREIEDLEFVVELFATAPVEPAEMWADLEFVPVEIVALPVWMPDVLPPLVGVVFFRFVLVGTFCAAPWAFEPCFCDACWLLFTWFWVWLLSFAWVEDGVRYVG